MTASKRPQTSAYVDRSWNAFKHGDQAATPNVALRYGSGQKTGMLVDFESNLKQLKSFQQNVILAPEQWQSFAPLMALEWQAVRFGADTQATVPESRGIYAFIVQFQDHSLLPLALPPHGYVMYCGITGRRGSQRTLRERYGDYLKEQRRPKRFSLWSMLNKWQNDLFFHFSPIADVVDLDATEIALNDAIIPPYVTNDFSAEVRALVRVLRAN
ncbi:MAG TPA: hypothetical protein VFP12_00495 [Allosphingosinicella sp.]|nr:hypothetical protein [Allosphingosinicella sp.]